MKRLPQQTTLVVETRELAAADQSTGYLSSLIRGAE
jgi:hypothetical protein